MFSKVFLVVVTLAVSICADADVVKIWEGREKPFLKPVDAYSEKMRGDGTLIVRNVSEPTLEVFPAPGKGVKPCVIVCPGGGYEMLTYNKEGTEIARWLNGLGFTAFVLKYRVPDNADGAFADACRALDLVRGQAAAYAIDPQRVGMIGFSAGANLTARVSTAGSRPDFALVIYPWELVSADSRSGLRVAALKDRYQVNASTPPTFLVQAMDDVCDAENALAWAGALKRAGVPCELHVFPSGGHGYGIRKFGAPTDGWEHLAATWLKRVATPSQAEVSEAPQAMRTSPYRQLFFDDQRLFVRENLDRVYGHPRFEAVYRDDVLANEYGWAWAVDGPDGQVHLIYMGEHRDSHKYILAAAVSEDGVRFRPRKTAEASGLATPSVPNQILPNPPNGEPAAVLVDPLASPAERYKLLFCDFENLYKAWRVDDYVLVSPDLVTWSKKEGSCWNRYGTEPLAGAFYNSVSGCFTILSRPDWGQRRVGIVETRNWRDFTDPELCLQADSLDPALTEIYGMPVFPYEGYYIGFPHVFNGVPQVRCLKFNGGRMHCELAYSLNGRHWQRSLREPFLDGKEKGLVASLGGEGKMLFLTSMRRDKDGSILLYGTATLNGHGAENAGRDPKRCVMCVFRLRQDGFVGLRAREGETGRLASRALICRGGGLSFNLRAEQATCAVYRHLSPGKGEPTQPVPGFGHDDCKPFGGDSVCWQPQWTSGDLKTLKGELIVVELKLRNGTVYSFSVDGIPQMEIEAERHRHFGNGFARPGL